MLGLSALNSTKTLLKKKKNSAKSSLFSSLDYYPLVFKTKIFPVLENNMLRIFSHCDDLSKKKKKKRKLLKSIF